MTSNGYEIAAGMDGVTVRTARFTPTTATSFPAPPHFARGLSRWRSGRGCGTSHERSNVNTEHLTPGERDLLAKARAALDEGRTHYVPAHPAAIIDLLTRLAEAQESVRKLEEQDRQSERFCKELVIRCAAGLNALAAQSPAVGGGEQNASRTK